MCDYTYVAGDKHITFSALGPQLADLFFDSKVITIYRDQEGAKDDYNPQKNGLKNSVCILAQIGVEKNSLTPLSNLESRAIANFSPDY